MYNTTIRQTIHKLSHTHRFFAMSSTQQKDPERVAAGLKAAVHNPNVSDEAKSNAKQRLNEITAEVEAENTTHDHHKLGGYKATLTNPKTSPEAKAHAREVLNDSDTSQGDELIDGKNAGNVLRGYKAALHNPRVSDEAKKHAEEVLREHKAV